MQLPKRFGFIFWWFFEGDMDRETTVRTTILDICRASGYAKSTVSAALNGGKGVGDKARRKILTIAKEMDYTPNELARSISSKSYNTIGVIIRDITNPFYAKVCRALEEMADRQGYTILICNTDENPQKVGKAIRTMIGRCVAGIVLDVAVLDEFIESFLRENRVPCVVFGRSCEFADSVEADDQTGLDQAVELLLANGHKKIAYIGPGAENMYSVRRYSAIRRRLESKDVQFSEIHCKSIVNNIEAGYEAVINGFSALDCTAVIAYNDMTAVGIMRAFAEKGLSVPKDISIVGFDDIETIAFPLTTVNIPEYEMGMSAMELLLERIKGRKEIRHIVLPTKLIVRGSVAPV